MVCLGNICRSPLAEGILKNKVTQKDLNWEVDSAGTGAWHVGNLPDSRSIAVAKKYGLDISTQSARQFKVSDFDTFDYIYAMDSYNYDNIISLARNNTDIKKVRLFLDANPSIHNKNMPHPYYGEQDDFEYVYKLVNETCDILAKALNG